MSIRASVAAVGFLALTALPASAGVINLTFEGIGNLQPVGSYYSGLGVEFSDATLAIVDADAGGSGNFANEPTPNTIMFFLEADNAILNFAAGFDTGFSFYYSSAAEAVVSVWDDINGTGNKLGEIQILGGGNTGPGDPTGAFATWLIGALAFNGTAKSINFGGTADYTGYDNITFGSTDPSTTPVPVPGAGPLLLTSLGGLAAFVRRRRKRA